MKGFVPTPRQTVDTMVDLLFQKRSPKPNDTVLDPGCGTGEFIDGIIRWCAQRNLEIPNIIGVESDSSHLPVLYPKYKGLHAVKIEHTDFLEGARQEYDFIVGNPPYVAITALTEREKKQYRANFVTARGRFDLYLLFFEQALQSMAEDGRLVFITPEKYLYVEAAGPLRDLLSRRHIEEIRLVRDDTFGKLVTYPTITVIDNKKPGTTQITRRDGSAIAVQLIGGHDSWLPQFKVGASQLSTTTLGDVCLRISCGVATGADSVYVQRASEIDASLRKFGYPTVAGRELRSEAQNLPSDFVMLTPYDINGRLLPLEVLGALAQYFDTDEIRKRLLTRTCVKYKPWYAFHETPPLRDILRPKILCKDISKTPRFWLDISGQIVPRHSVYYIVPKVSDAINVIAEYLRSSAAQEWLTHNCQRAAQGFLRLQSHVLQRLPLPDEVAKAAIDEHSVLQLGLPTLIEEQAFHLRTLDAR